MVNLILCKPPFLFSTVKLKLGHEFSQLVLDSKLRFSNVRHPLMTFTKREKRGHAIMENFADICGWFLGKGYFSDLVDVNK